MVLSFHTPVNTPQCLPTPYEQGWNQRGELSYTYISELGALLIITDLLIPTWIKITCPVRCTSLFKSNRNFFCHVKKWYLISKYRFAILRVVLWGVLLWAGEQVKFHISFVRLVSVSVKSQQSSKNVMFNWQMDWDKNAYPECNKKCPHESMERHRKHRCRNREVDQFCLGTISKYWEISYRCIAWLYPVWAGSRSWVRRHRSLHISITAMG